MNKVLKGNRLHPALLAGASISHMLNDLVPQLAPALLPAFIEEFDLSIIQAGQLVSIPFICGIVALFLGGVLADRVNHVSQSIVALSLIGASSLLVIFTRDWVLLLIVFCFILVGNNLFHPAGFSLSSKLFKPERKTTALGFFNAGGILGFAFGPLSVGVFYGLVDWRMIYMFWSLLIICDVIYLAILKLKKAWNPGFEKTLRKPSRASLKSVLTFPFIILILIIGIQWLGRHMILTYFTSFLVFERGFIIQEASIFLSLISIVGIIGGPFGGYIADRFGVIRWFMICFAGLAGCTYLILISPIGSMLVLSCLLFGFFAAGEMTTGSSLVSTYVHGSWIGLGYSFYFLSINGMNGVAPMVGAFIAKDYGFSAILLTAPLFMLTSLIMAYGFLKRRHDTLHINRY